MAAVLLIAQMGKKPFRKPLQKCKNTVKRVLLEPYSSGYPGH
jgi:hypothetical protein